MDEFGSAEEQKVFLAEKRISAVRAAVIVFGSLTFFFLDNPYIHRTLTYGLMAVIWSYGAFVLIAKPYEKYPVFMAAWLTYAGDGLFTTLWVYATGAVESPYYVIYYTSVVAVAFRFGLRTTLFTCALYSACYMILLALTGQLAANLAVVVVRCGFNFIVGWLTLQITRETLLQARQKLMMKSLMEEAQSNHRRLSEQQERMNALNRELLIRNNLFSQAEENAGIGSYAYYPESGRIDYSDNMYRLFGRQPGDFVPSMEKHLSFIHPDDRENVRVRLRDAINGVLSGPTECRIVYGAAEVRHIRMTGSVMTYEGEQVLIGTLQDITNDMQMNETLRQKNLELERSNQELSSFNYVASHDMREPLRKIITFSELALDRQSSIKKEMLRNYLERVKGAALRMQHLIEAFLNYSAISATPSGSESVDLNLLMRDLQRTLSDSVQSASMKITFSDLPAVKGSRFQLEQLFLHLLDNAVKYAKPGETAEVTISAEPATQDELRKAALPADESYWKISVVDKGIGFEQKYAERIFGVFQRLHAKESYPGTGMGLAICKKVVFNHGGFIEAYSSMGTGSTFVVYLPANVVRQPVTM